MKKIKEYLIELSLIVFGVFIAISVDDYREKSKTDAMLRSYLNVLKNDLSENMKLLDEEIFYDSIALNRFGLIRDKVWGKSYDGLDTLMLHLAEHSQFTLNDTGFRLIVQSGNSHTIESVRLAQLTDLFGATMTDLNFYQNADWDTYGRSMAFFVKHHPHVGERIRLPQSEISRELINVVMGRLATLGAEREQKKKLRRKIIDVLKAVDEENLS
jgi:hypothetical protein